MGTWDTIKGYGGQAKGFLDQFDLGSPYADKLTQDSAGTIKQRQDLDQQGNAASAFADQGQAGFGTLGAESAANRQRLMDQATGRVSLSGEQLRQALAQNQANQISNAASAAPQNAVSAARTAAIQAGRQGYGMAGQAATAGIQERTQAAQALSDDIARQRNMELQAALNSRQNAVQGYQAVKPEGSFLDKYGNAIVGGIGAVMASDRRLKTSVREGDSKAGALLEAIGAKSYKYKNAKHGEGEQLGIMAQDLERGGLKSAVIDTPGGKMVHGAKAAGAALALTAALHKRVKKLEGRK